MATAEFSKFAGILSAALSQHHLSGFGIAQLEFHHLHSFVRSDAIIIYKMFFPTATSFHKYFNIHMAMFFTAAIKHISVHIMTLQTASQGSTMACHIFYGL